jgi:hypothetical protein
MRHTVILLPLTLSWLFIALACSQGGNPFSLPEAISPGSAGAIRPSQTHLWGYYDVFVDVRGKTATVVFNRQAMFTANVVNFINGKPTDLSVHIHDTPVGGDYVDVDIDVTLTHPFPGLTQYNGYDVRGVFMGDGSANLSYNPALLYPMPGTDQYMLPDPDDGIGGPDGYTRWFNKAEFSTGGIPLLQYTQGKIATPGFNGTATLCPYRYFADYLGKDENLWSWLTDPDNNNPNGVFGAGQGNTRNYYLRFPNMKGVRFGYAVLADWAGTEPQFHPSNAAEAIALSVIDNSTVYYSSPSQKGGNVKLDIGVWDWDSQATGGVMQDYRIFLESTVLSNVYQFNTADMTGTGGGEHFSMSNRDMTIRTISA